MIGLAMHPQLSIKVLVKTKNGTELQVTQEIEPSFEFGSWIQISSTLLGIVDEESWIHLYQFNPRTNRIVYHYKVVIGLNLVALPSKGLLMYQDIDPNSHMWMIVDMGDDRRHQVKVLGRINPRFPSDATITVLRDGQRYSDVIAIHYDHPYTNYIELYSIADPTSPRLLQLLWGQISLIEMVDGTIEYRKLCNDRYDKFYLVTSKNATLVPTLERHSTLDSATTINVRFKSFYGSYPSVLFPSIGRVILLVKLMGTFKEIRVHDTSTKLRLLKKFKLGCSGGEPRIRKMAKISDHHLMIDVDGVNTRYVLDCSTLTMSRMPT